MCESGWDGEYGGESGSDGLMEMALGFVFADAVEVGGAARGCGESVAISVEDDSGGLCGNRQADERMVSKLEGMEAALCIGFILTLVPPPSTPMNTPPLNDAI